MLTPEISSNLPLSLDRCADISGSPLHIATLTRVIFTYVRSRNSGRSLGAATRGGEDHPVAALLESDAT